MISTKSSKAEYLISMCEILQSGIVGSNILKLNNLILGCSLVHPLFSHHVSVSKLTNMHNQSKVFTAVV